MWVRLGLGKSFFWPNMSVDERATSVCKSTTAASSPWKVTAKDGSPTNTSLHPPCAVHNNYAEALDCRGRWYHSSRVCMGQLSPALLGTHVFLFSSLPMLLGKSTPSHIGYNGV